MRRDGHGLIDRSEMQRLNLKFQAPLKQDKPKRKKDKDDSIWIIRQDPEPRAQPSCLEGFRSLKHKWLSQYQQQTGENGAAALDQPAKFFTLVPTLDTVPVTEGDANLMAARDSNQPPQIDAPGSFDHPAAQANMAAAASNGNSGDQEKQKLPADTSIDQVLQGHASLQGLQSRKSLPDAKLGRDAPASPRELGEFAAQRPNSPANKKSMAPLNRTPSKVSVEKTAKQRLAKSPTLLRQASERSPVEKPTSPKASPQKPGRLKSTQTTPSKDKASKSGDAKQKSGQKQSVVDGVKPQNGLKIAKKRKAIEISPTERSIQDRHKPTGASSQSKENKVQGTAVNSQRDERSQHFLATQPKAKDASSMVKILYVDGQGSELLGDLDLSQLESFRELSLIINSAYGHRLPTAQYKLVYRDIDDDLMIHKNEPWSYFKANAATLLLMDSLQS